MFYCDECRKVKKWPTSTCRLRGVCEFCCNPAMCYDVPASRLPKAPELTSVETATAAMRVLTPEQRRDVLRNFCPRCGGDERGKPCNCRLNADAA